MSKAIQTLERQVQELTEKLRIIEDRKKSADERMKSQEYYAVAIAELEFDALSGFDIKTLMNAACSLVSHSLGVEYCMILELLADGKSLIFRAGIGWKSDISSIIFDVGTDSMAGYTLISKQPVLLENRSNEMRFQSQLLEQYGIASGMGYIIGNLDKPYGVIEVYTSKERKFTMDEIQFMETVTHVLGEAIKSRQAEEALKRAKEEAERANNAKTDFLMTMSHELRTPLNSVIGFSQILKQKTCGDLNEKQEQYVSNVLNGGSHLLRIINQILDVVKLESGTLDLSIEKVSVRRTVDDALDIIKEKADRQKIFVEKELDPELEFIEADGEKFRHVLFNILENAVKFSKPEGGKISIITKKEGDMARFSISDNGIGIKEEDTGKLFQKFVQIDSGASRKYGGIGIGLAVSKQFVELHGGSIGVESKIGSGSTFTILMPVHRTPLSL